MCVSHSVMSNSATPWTIAHQAPLCMEFSRQEYWSELPFPFPGNLPNPGIELRSPALQADALPSELQGKSESEVTQLCLTLYDFMDCSLPGSSVHGIFQARILEWVAFPTPGNILNPGIKPMSLASPALGSGFFTTAPPGKLPFQSSLGSNEMKYTKTNSLSSC